MPDEPTADAPFDEQPTLRDETPGAPDVTPRSTGSGSVPAAGSHIMGTIGDFEVIDKLGQGGMGTVYRARQISLGRMVALKILPAQFEEDEDFVGRFQREARLAASLVHPNLVRVYASGLAEGSHYIAMELVEGETLSRRVKRGALAPAEAVRICLAVARALQCGWQSGQLIHRDIKPSNIYLSHSGEVKLGDLGLAKSLAGNTTGLTHTGTMMGTPHYISPEQARGDKTTDFRADIYSLGCTLYQCLTGQTPYVGTDPLTVMNLHLSGPPPALLKVMPGCPIPLARLVGKMLKKQRHERHQSYEELIEQLESVLVSLEAGPVDTGAEARLAMWREVGGGAPVTPPPPARPPSAAAGKSRLPLYAGLAALLVVGAGIAWWAMQPKKPQSTRTTSLAATKANNAIAASATPPMVTDLKASPVSKSAPPAPVHAGEAWQDALHVPKMLSPSGNFELTPEGLRITGSGSVHIGPHEEVARYFKKQPSLAVHRDGAVRLRTTYTGGYNPSATVRSKSDTGLYQASVVDRGAVLLRHYDNRAQGTIPIRQFPLPQPLEVGQAYTLELRVVGPVLTVLFNGVVLGSVEDSAYTEGLFGLLVGTVPQGLPPTLVTSLEFLNLDGLPEADARKLVDSTTTAATAAIAWQPLRSPTEWQAIKTDKMEFRDGLLHLRNVGLFTKPHQAAADGAVRAKVRIMTETNYFSIFGRTNAQGDQYKLVLGKSGTASLERGDAAYKSHNLAKAQIPRTLREGDVVSLELRIRGSRLTGLVDGEVLFDHEDNTVRGAGGWGIHASNGAYESAEVQLGPPTQPSMPTPAAVTKDAPFVNSLGMKFVPVPITGGPTDGQRVLFGVWNVRVQDYAAYAAAEEATGQNVDGAWKTQQKDGVPIGREPEHPVVGVSWDEAQGFCRWLTEKEHAEGRLPRELRYRLPSDHEWSCAVGIGAQEDAAKTPEEKNGKNDVDFPWGKDYPPTRKVGNYADESFHAKFPLKRNEEKNLDENLWMKDYTDGFATTSPVGSFPANAYGLHDMGGNVWQWCEDWYDDKKERRVLRGAPWAYSDRNNLRSSCRYRVAPTTRNNDRGFRCVLVPSAPEGAGASAAPAGEQRSVAAPTSGSMGADGGAPSTATKDAPFFPRAQTPFGHALTERNSVSQAGVSAGGESGRAGLRTPPPPETEFRPFWHSQTEFGNEGFNERLKRSFGTSGQTKGSHFGSGWGRWAKFAKSA